MRDALQSLRYSHSLRHSPLLSLDLVAVRLRTEGLADTPRTRQWVLGQLLDGVVWEHLQHLRGANGPVARSPRSPDDSIRELRDDFASGVVEREAWAILHFRYLSDVAAPGKTSIQATGVPQRTLYRRLRHGVEALVDALREIEHTAAAQLLTMIGDAVPDLVFVDEAVSVQHDTVAALHDRLAGQVGALRTDRAELDRLAQVSPSDETSYRLARVAAWLQPRHRLDERFVQLSLLADTGDGPGQQQAHEERFSGLREALASLREPASVAAGSAGVRQEYPPRAVRTGPRRRGPWSRERRRRGAPDLLRSTQSLPSPGAGRGAASAEGVVGGPMAGTLSGHGLAGIHDGGTPHGVPAGWSQRDAAPFAQGATRSASGCGDSCSTRLSPPPRAIER